MTDKDNDTNDFVGENAKKFKDSSMKKTISNLLIKYKPQELSNLKQDDIIKALEKERDQEQDEKTRGDIDHLIQVIKDFFSKKFDANKARLTTSQRLQEERVQQKIREFIAKNPQLQNSIEQLAKKMLKEQTINCFIDKYKLTPEAQEKSQSQDGWVRKL